MQFCEWSEAAIQDLVALVSASDGHPRGAPDRVIWRAVANSNRWRADEATAAVAEMAGRHTGAFGAQILPGAVAEVIRENRKFPRAFADQQAELEAVREPDATAEVRLAAIAEFVELQTRRMTVPEPHDDPLVAEQRAGWRKPNWAAIDGCAVCDERGIRRDVPDVVCSHPQRNPGCDPQEERVGSGAHTTTEEADHEPPTP